MAVRDKGAALQAARKMRSARPQIAARRRGTELRAHEERVQREWERCVAEIYGSARDSAGEANPITKLFTIRCHLRRDLATSG